ncbi:MAG: VWA domain-containing protein, partial [Alphaproteobacteria bacterium]|nr:VWA domain-containing protein [Alphaproteobacteria bacterium]
PGCAALLGTEAAVALAGAAMRAGVVAGAGAANALLGAAGKAGRVLGTADAFLDWLGVIERVAHLAPDVVEVLLDHTETVLSHLGVRGLETWALSGIRAAAGDAGRRRHFFALIDPAARSWLGRGVDDMHFSAVERRMQAYLLAVWNQQPRLRAQAGSAIDVPRRTSFDGDLVFVPETYRGFGGDHAVALFRAALAHVAAHRRFTPARFPLGGLKPLQVAIVSALEDARVERLAIAEFPGLRRLWLPFHVAAPVGALTAPGLIARLARALIDGDFVDTHAWIEKGRRLFGERPVAAHDHASIRAIGSVLGNDLGQMRVQFNPRTYVTDPLYRDDNRGLWDFGDAAGNPETAEMLPEAVRVEAEERDDGRGDRQGEAAPDETGRARPVAALEDEAGIEVARYPEWDYLIGRERPDWTTVLEFEPPLGPAGLVAAIHARHRALADKLSALIRAARVSRPERRRRQMEGDRLDLDAAIAAAVERRQGGTPDPRLYMTVARRGRDLTTLLLLDISQSTADRVRGAEASVLALEREATVLLAHAMAGLGDPFAIGAFCSNGRDEVRYYRVKDLAAPFGAPAQRRLSGLAPGYSTRIGAAIRHAGQDLRACRSHRRLLLVVTDGEPSDVDIADRRYLVEDARKAVMTLAHAGIDVFCVGLDAGGDAYLERIFGRRNVLLIDRIERLPERLPALYLKLTT